MTGPLKQLKILDFSTLLPGPYATMLLADMGADVIRIESPTRADMLKETSPKFEKYSYAHYSINRNKRSLAIDLKNPQAKEVIVKLIADYDILIEQFRPGVMKKFGLDYESLKIVNPKLIYCSITGYGQTGELKNRAGHDINYLALSGLASYSGRKESGPSLSATQIADLAGGSHHAVMSILAAEIARRSTDLGQHLDISIRDTAFSLNTMFGASALASEVDPDLEDQILNGGSFYDYYKTSDGRYISVGSLEPKFAKLFFETIARPQWLMRAANKEEIGALKADIAEVFALQDYQYWKNKFNKIDACIEPVLSINEVANHPMFESRKMILEIKLANDHQIKQIAPAVKFSENREDFFVGKKLGEDSETILRSIGYSDARIDQLIKNGIITLCEH